MENTNKQVSELFSDAKAALVADMKSRGIGAIIWNNETAGFPYLPEVVCHSKKDPEKSRVATIMGLYRYNGVV